MRDKLKAFVEKWRTSAKAASGVEECALCLSAAIDIHEILRESQWVPVTERMPGVLLDVFTWDGNAYHIAYRREGAWIRSDGFFLRNVTHWHAIDYPQPPEVT